MAKLVHGGNPVQPGKVDHALAVEVRERIRDQEQRIGTFESHRRKSHLEVVGLTDAEGLYRYVKYLRRLFHLLVAQRHPAIGGVPENRDARRLGHRFLEELQTFRAQLGGLIGDPRHVSSWPREALDQADGVGVTDLSQHDRDRRGCLLGGLGRRPSDRDDRVNVESDQFGSETGKPIPLGLRPPTQVDNVLLLDVAELLEGLA